jgi:spore germination protein YaaH
MDDTTTAPGRAIRRRPSDEGERAPRQRTATKARRADGDEQPASTARKTGRRLIALSVVAIVLLGALIAYAMTRPEKWHRTGPPASVSGWAPYWQTDSALASFNDNRNVFDDLSLFAYQATAADAVGPFPALDGGVPDTYRDAAHAVGVKLTASIIDGTDSGVMAGILADPASRALHVDTILAFAEAGNFDGIDLDYEKFAFSDSRDTWEATRPNWVAFVNELADELHRAGKTLTVSVPSSGDYWVYDYEAMGKVVDKIRIMAYDYSTGDPGPIAPIEWVEAVVESAKELVPAEKLVLGVPVYGYDWPGRVTGTCPGGESDQPSRRSVSMKTAAALAAEKGVIPIWDPETSERTFRYTDVLSGTDPLGAAVSCTVDHVVWYADAQSVHDRAYLAHRQDLSGIAIWSLGSEDPVSWDGIDAARAGIEVWPPVDTAVATTAVATTLTGG